MACWDSMWFVLGGPAWPGDTRGRRGPMRRTLVTLLLVAGLFALPATAPAAGVLGVVEPYSCGIGGGGFMTIYSARDGTVHTIDSRETAPAAMTPDSFKGLTTFEAQRVSGMS